MQNPGALLPQLGLTALVLLPALLCLAASGIPLVTALVSLPAVKRTKIFRDKFGQQVVTFAIVALIAGLAGMAGVYFAPKPVDLPLTAVAAACLVPSWPVAALVLGGTLLLLAYRATWHKLKTEKLAHAGMGIASWLLFALALALEAGQASARITARPPAEAALSILDAAGFIPLPALLEILLLQFALACLASLFYCVFRRNRDDFGRDYYIYAVSLCLRLAIGPALGAAALETARFAVSLDQVAATGGHLLYIWPAAPLAVLVAALVWALVMRNLNPLRFKELLAASLAVILLAVALALTAACTMAMAQLQG